MMTARRLPAGLCQDTGMRTPAAPHSTSVDSFPELQELRAILDDPRGGFNTRVLAEPSLRGRRFPVHMATLGSDDPQAPCLGIFGGIHGLERIGTQVILSYMRSLIARLQWDEIAAQPAAPGAAGVRAHRQPLGHVGGPAQQPQRRGPDAQRPAARGGPRALPGRWPAPGALAALVLRPGRQPHGAGKRRAAGGGAPGADQPPLQPGAGLPFGATAGTTASGSPMPRRAG